MLVERKLIKYLLLVIVCLLELSSTSQIRVLYNDVYKPWRTFFDLNFGNWENSVGVSNNALPVYYICGAEMNSYSQYITQKHNCGRSWYRWKFRGKCQEKQKLIWTRTNGMKFQFCNIQNWGQQITKERGTSWPWQGMKMCPEGQYVSGFQVKMDSNNGLNGLILLCQTLSGSASSRVLVKDGIGSWNPISQGVPNQFANQFQLKVDHMITGLSFWLSVPVLVASLHFDYRVPAATWFPYSIEKQYVINPNRKQINKALTFNANVKIEETHRNAQNYLSAQNLNYAPEFTITATATFDQASDQSTSNNQFGYFGLNPLKSSFIFGTPATRLISSSLTPTVSALPCSELTAFATIQEAHVVVPYTAKITYKMFTGATDYVIVNGNYYGKLASPTIYVTTQSKNIIGCNPLT